MRRGSLSQSLFIPLIPPYNCICTLAIGKKAGAQGISIAVIIHSFDPTLQLHLHTSNREKAGAQGISIAVIIHSFDPTLQLHLHTSNREKGWWAGGSLSQSLFIPLIPPYNCICTLAIGKKAGGQGISIAVIIHSFDRTLHIVFSRLRDF